MNVREAKEADQAAIAEVAERSLEASYSLSPGTIEGAVRKWYGDEEFAEKLEREDLLILLAELDDEVVGFTESARPGNEGADLLWLHVHPDYRGQGIGSDLFEATRDRLDELGATHLRGRVLAINEAGNTFYREQGFEKVGEGEVEIDGSPYTENLYLEAEPSGLQPVRAEDGQTVYVDHDDVERGSLAGFNVVYVDDAREEKYGYYCSKCESLANAMDAMGRIECGNCGNVRKPTRWDAAYM